ncbi:MAG: CPBP family intramembrane metalloprotease [Defluviitaleaceae bacterium]|nr:CPBP family intramembrane metalloprotease [Defluviitaleaceae bacterium]
MEHRRGSAFMLFMLIFYVIFMMVFSLIVSRFGAEFMVRVFSSPWSIVFRYLMTFILPLVIWLTVTRCKLASYLPSKRIDKMNIIFIIFLSIFLQPLMMFISGISSLFFPNQASAVVGGMMAQPLWLLILAFAVTPAICEEIIFRGYIQSAYRHYPFIFVALINGLFFAIIHLSFQQFLYTFAMGIIFAYVVHYSRSIFAGILMHFMMNTMQIFLLWWTHISGVELIPTWGTFYERLSTIMGVGLVALLTTPCAVILFKSFLSHNRQHNITHDMQKELLDTPLDVVDESVEAPPKPTRLLFLDPFGIAVVLLFLLIMFLLQL